MTQLTTFLGKTRSSDGRKARPFLWAIYAYCLFDDLVFIYSFYAVMFSECGLGAFQISALFAVWSTVVFILEVPSGALADKYSRKHILVFAQIVRIIGYGCWMLLPTFWGFLFGFVCWGIKCAFTSGTFQALVFDELKSFGAEDDYAKVIGRARGFSAIGVLIADASAALMIGFGYGFLIVASLIALGFSCASIAFVRPAERAESTGERHYFALLKEGVREAFRNRVVLRLIVFLSFALVFFGSLEEYWSLFYREAGIPKAGIALLCAAVTAVQVVAGVVAHRFSRLPERAPYAAYLVAGISLLIASYLMRPISVVCMPLVSFLWTVIDVVLEARLQRAIVGDARATVLSVRGFLEEIAAMHIYIGFGAVASRWDYRAGFMTGAAVMTLIGTLYLVLGGQRPRRDRSEDG